MIYNPSISFQNTFVGNNVQEATSVITKTDQDCYDGGGGCFSIYGFEVRIATKLVSLFNTDKCQVCSRYICCRIITECQLMLHNT